MKSAGLASTVFHSLVNSGDRFEPFPSPSSSVVAASGAVSFSAGLGKGKCISNLYQLISTGAYFV